MGNKPCIGGTLFERGSRASGISSTYVLIWVDDKQKKNVRLKSCLKELDSQLIKFDDNDSCEGYIRRRYQDHFILVICYKLANILIPEIDELPQLDSVFVYDFSSTQTYKSWMKQCQKVVKELFIDLNQLERSLQEYIGRLRQPRNIQNEVLDLLPIPTEIRERSNTNVSSNSTSSNSDAPYYLIWLAANVDSDEQTKDKLKSISTCELRTFHDIYDCVEHVLSSPKDRFLFIISYDFAKKITPKIASLKQTITILIYSSNPIPNTSGSWVDQYLSKVQAIVTDLTKLESVVRFELQKYGLCKNECDTQENNIIINVFNQKEMATKNLQSEKGNFLWFKLLVEVLINMKDTEKAQKELIEILKLNYPKSDFVNDFAMNYQANSAIEWFTRDHSCLLKELNKALRKQHLDHLFFFRGLIRDLYYALKSEHDKEVRNNQKKTTFYRRQVINQSELKQLLQANTGELIAINSFMSAWTDRSKAIAASQRSHCDIELVCCLFELEVDYKKKSNPFARIHDKQDQVLFMLGCIFRIHSITLNDTSDHCHVLKLELCDDNDANLKTIFDYITKDIIQPESDLITLGSLLHRMGELDKAEKYFQLVLSESDEYDSNYRHCLDRLGDIQNDQGHPAEALKHHFRALQLRQKYGSTDTDMSVSYINIANDYTDMKDYTTALTYVRKARNLIEKTNLREDQPKLSACYFIQGSIYYDKGNRYEALEQFEHALAINKQLNMPDDHPDMASIYQSMGLCYLNPDGIGNSALLALNCFVEALEIRLKTLPHNHPKIGITYRSIGLAYEQLQEYQYARKFFQNAYTIHKVLNKTYRDLKVIEEDIERIKKYDLTPTFSTTTHLTTRSNSFYRSLGDVSNRDSNLSTMSTPESTSPKSARRLILLGRSSEIKTAFGKTLLAQKMFSMMDDNETSRSIGIRCLNEKMLFVIDTPSFNEENLLTANQKTEIAKSLKLSYPGPHAFLVVCEYTPDRTPSEIADQQFTDALVDIFGPEIFRYIVFVFTNIEKLRTADIGTELYMKKHRSRAFTDLMKRCNDRFISIDSKAPQSAKDHNFAELILIIDRMLTENKGQKYAYESPWLRQTANKIFEIDKRLINTNPMDFSNKGFEMKFSKEKLDYQSTVVFTDHIFDLSIQPYKYHAALSQQNFTEEHPVYLKLLSNTPDILIICFDIDYSLRSVGFDYKIESFDSNDECVCIARLLSLINTRVYFMISYKAGRYLVPLIHQHRFIEQIYVYCSDENQRTSSWINDCQKIRNISIHFHELRDKLHKDIELILSHSILWSNSSLLQRCHSQTCDDLSRESFISLNIIHAEKYSKLNRQIHLNIVILHCDQNAALFRMDSQHYLLRQFEDVHQCIEYLRTIDIDSVLFILSGEISSLICTIRKLAIFEQIYAIYLFTPNMNQIDFDENLKHYHRIGRLFDNLEYLLKCLTSDIKFYLEEPLYIPIVSVLNSDNYDIDENQMTLTKNDEKFFAFQFFLNTIQKAPDLIYRKQNLYNRCLNLADEQTHQNRAMQILKTNPDEIFDWSINLPFLSVVMNSFLNEEFPQNLLDIQLALRNIDKFILNSNSTTISNVVYRVQLSNKENLAFLKTNMNQFISFQTYMIATRHLSMARTIARQAADRGLSVLIFQIEIPIGSHLADLEQDRVVFRFGSIFRCRSIDQAPDRVWYAQMTYADFDFHLIEQRLQIQIGIELSWLTLGNYLHALHQIQEAKFFFSYLENILPRDHRALGSIYNNMGLMFTQLDDREQALKYFQKAETLMNSKAIKTDEISSKTFFTIPTRPDGHEIKFHRYRLFENIGDIHNQKADSDKALIYYRKALESAADPLSRVRLEQKIRSLISS